ncbi:extracellular solute-binding protein [Jiangella endophytica]|uniref:extracellular solute-binding protein n=1 Tax=Jiangella endophytica TaxID=1623398 RepID=UPI0013006150|nr:extracellular solute-binding protein [Jiangella endophytica]
MGSTFTRRGLLQASLGGSALLGLGALVGCSSSGTGTGDAVNGASNNKAMLPDHLPYDGITPDFPGQPGLSTDAYATYPSEPVRAYATAPGDGQPLSGLSYFNGSLRPDLDRNLYWQAMNTAIGSDLQITVVPAAEYGSKFATVTAGNTLPDMFTILPTLPAIPQLLQARAVDLTPYLAGDAITAYPSLANIPTASWQGCVFGGKIRALPIERGLQTTKLMYLRRDIAESAGLDAQVSDFADFRSLCAELSAPQSNRWALANLPLDYVRSMLAIAGPWTLEGGTIVSNWTREEQLDALEAARGLYEAGYLNPDVLAAPPSQTNEWFHAGTAALKWDTYSAWTGFYVYSGVEGFGVQGLPVPGFDGGKGQPVLGAPNIAVSAISADSEDRIETILKIADWLAAPFGTQEYLLNKYGEEGVHHELQDGNPVLLDERKGEYGLGHIYLAASPTVFYYPGSAEISREPQDHQRSMLPDAVPDPTVGLYSETGSRSFAGIVQDVEALEADIIGGRRPVSEWTSEIEAVLAGGLQSILDEYNEAYEQSQ